MENKQIIEDIKTIVGGNFSPDALSPEIYNEILERARSRAKEYLEEFEKLYLECPKEKPLVDFYLAQADLYLPNFLELLKDKEPKQVLRIARVLVGQYNNIFLGYQGAMIYSRIENSLSYFDLFIEKTYKYLRVNQDSKKLLF